MKKFAVWKGLFCILFVCAAGILYLYMTKAADENPAAELILRQEAGALPEDEMRTETETETETEAEVSVYVHVCGAVREPGVYALAGGSRISDAVLAAGDFLPDAARDYLNLAQLVSDGQKIYVPTKEEAENAKTAEHAGEGASLSEEGTTYVNINTAAAGELMELPGIGRAKAEAIVTYREEHGAFSACEELMQVPGIKESIYEKLCDAITVGE